MDSKYCSSCTQEGRALDTRVVDKTWRQDRLPVLDLEVPSYELPLPEGVGEESQVGGGGGGNLSMREIEESWRERLHDNPPTTHPVRHPSQ